MYSFRQRADTTVVDEPLYAHYLRVTGRHHPHRATVMESQSPDGDAVVRDVILGPVETPVLFCKQMAHHLVDLDRSFLGECRNLLLTRHPEEMLRSLAVQLPDASLADTGLENLVAILEAILRAGEEPVVIDSRALLADPRAVLHEVCLRTGLEFDDSMLSWPAGPKPEDGIWAPHWYSNVHHSTGFRADRPSDHPWPERLDAILAEALPLYEMLVAYAV
ncbi:MAG: sulfotransferase family protein [Actinomycetia bacterium]|nr:sulfotransferase family protein [Actinomycetes bacterium]